MGRLIIQPMLMVGSSAMGPSWWITLGVVSLLPARTAAWKRVVRGCNETHLTMMSPMMSSSSAALTRTMPTRVCTKSRSVVAPLMTTKVVPREVADSAAPMMKVSTGPGHVSQRKCRR